MSKIIIMNIELILNLLTQFLSGKNNNSKTNDKSFDFSALAGFIPKIAEMFGIPLELIKNILALLPKLKNGEISLKQLLPVFAPILLDFLKSYSDNNKTTSEQDSSEVVIDCLKLEPIESLTDDSILSSLNDYFENDTAS